ncbi:MAG: hypothetical protein LBR11_01145 [Deltaproteobacteria bacterium]|jgi:hypothetical protein|nr:hypothetical protein [Deltaproteobacteria bacterium]
MYKFSKTERAYCPPTVTKVIFLDIDGVLQPHSSQKRFNHIKDGSITKLYEELKRTHNVDYSVYNKRDVAAVYYDWRKSSVALLRDILLKTGAKIVLSSDWRIFGMNTMYDFFTIHGLEKYYIDQTIDSSYDLKDDEFNNLKDKYRIKYKNNDIYFWRVIEILDYLNQYPHIKNYVAVDDLMLNPGLENHFVQTNDWITDADAADILKILESND